MIGQYNIFEIYTYEITINDNKVNHREQMISDQRMIYKRDHGYHTVSSF